MLEENLISGNPTTLTAVYLFIDNCFDHHGFLVKISTLLDAWNAGFEKSSVNYCLQLCFSSIALLSFPNVKYVIK